MPISLFRRRTSVGRLVAVVLAMAVTPAVHAQSVICQSYDFFKTLKETSSFVSRVAQAVVT